MKLFKEFYLTSRFLHLTALLIFLFFISYFIPSIFIVVKVLLVLSISIVVAETYLLFKSNSDIYAERIVSDRLSNGDQNPVTIILSNNSVNDLQVSIIDELPFIFQIRDFEVNSAIGRKTTKYFDYTIRPVKRGEYQFGSLNIYISTFLHIVRRRYRFEKNKVVSVYPSYIQMKKYQLMAVADRLTEIGVKKIRKIGHSMEFEQIKEYIQGDDYRTINWKATARKSQLMVNHYVDEKAQQIYCLIDMGRNMKMPFDNMSLVDYAINSSLVISNIALMKYDKAGIITFNSKISSQLPAERTPSQMKMILDLLYKQQTDFLESDYEKLVALIKSKVKQRSLFLLFTNIESTNALKRQIKYFKAIASSHLLIIVFFNNTGLDQLLNSKPKSVEEVYKKVIAEKFSFEKKIIQKELSAIGIMSILTTPQQLSVDTVNKYLELKARGMI